MKKNFLIANEPREKIRSSNGEKEFMCQILKTKQLFLFLFVKGENKNEERE